MTQLVLRVVVLATLVLVGCGDAGQAPATAPSTRSPMPTPSDDVTADQVAIEFREAAVVYMEERADIGKLVVGPAVVEEVNPYGPVMMLKLVDPKKMGLLEAALFTLVSMAKATGLLENELAALDISYTGFVDPTGGRIYFAVEDLLDFEQGRIDLVKLRDKGIPDY